MSIIKHIRDQCTNHGIIIDVKNLGKADEELRFFKDETLLCVQRCCYAQTWSDHHRWFLVKIGLQYNVETFDKKLDAAMHCIDYIEGKRVVE